MNSSPFVFSFEEMIKSNACLSVAKMSTCAMDRAATLLEDTVTSPRTNVSTVSQQVADTANPWYVRSLATSPVTAKGSESRRHQMMMFRRLHINDVILM